MSRQARVVVVLALVMLLAVGAAVALVLSPSDETVRPAGPDEETAAATETEPTEPSGEESTSRRRSRREGSCSLFGVVQKGEKREPVAGQEVLLISEETGEVTVETSPEGTFRFDTLPDGGPYEVRVTSKGFATVRLPGIALDRDEKRDLGSLILDAAVRLEVEVRSLSDVAIADAEVLAFAAAEIGFGFDWTKAMAQLGQEPVPVATVKTNAEGKAVFPELAAGTWTVVARKDGHARRGRASQRLRAKEDRSPMVLYLGSGYSLKGTVTNQDGDPVAGALVMAGKQNDAWNPQTAPLRIRAIADDRGAYELASLGSGDLVLWAGPPDSAPGQVAILRVPDVDHFDVVLRAGGTLKGKVTDHESGEPIEGASVMASSWGPSGQRWANAVTDKEGAYVITTLPEGTVNQIMASKEGMVRHQDPDTPQWQQTPIRRGEVVEKDLELTKGGSGSGVVTGPDGPIAGAKVVAMGGTPQTGWDQKSATTDAAGKFSFPALQTGKHLIQVTKPGYYQKDFPQNWWMALQQNSAPAEYTLEVEGGDTPTLDIALTTGATVEGKVETVDGEAVSGARIQARSQTMWGGWQQQQNSALSGSDGSFRIEGVSPSATVSVTAVREGWVQLPTDPVDVADDGPTTDVVVRMRKQPFVKGTILSAVGEPVLDAYVQVMVVPDNNGQNQLYDPSTFMAQQERHPVKADGSYSVPVSFAQGKVTVTAGAVGYAVVSSKPEALKEDMDELVVNLEFEDGHQLTGRVVTVGGGEGIPGAHVTISADSQGRQDGRMQQMMMVSGRRGGAGTIVAVTDETGAFTASNLGTGGYRANATAYGYVAGGAKGSVPGGAGVTIELGPELEISGSVVFGDGRGVEGVNVAAQRKNSGNGGMNGFPGMGGGAGNSVTDAAGRFVIRGLGAGTYTLNVAPGWQSKANVQPFASEPTEGGATGVKLVAREGLKISGTVVDEAGEPVLRAQVNANPMKPKPNSGNTWRNAQSKANGTFEIVGLDPDAGVYRLQINAQNFGGGQQYTPVTMEDVAPGTTGLKITMKSGLAIEGDIVDEAGKPMRGQAWIMAQPIREDGEQGSRNGQNAMVDEKGHFKVSGLQPGRYRLDMNTWGPGGNKQLVLTGGADVAAGSSGLKLTATSGAKISGTVVDQNGAGASNAWVNANPVGGGQGRNGQTNESGEFEITGLADGVDYNVQVNSQGKIGQKIDGVSAGTTGLQLTLRDGVSVKGRLQRSNGEIVPSTHVWLQPDSSERGATNQSGQTDEDGNFDIGGLIEGETYSAKAWVQNAEGGGMTQSPCGKVTAGDTNVTLEIVDSE